MLLAVLIKIAWDCFPPSLVGTDKIRSNRGSMHLEDHGVPPEDTKQVRKIRQNHTYANVREIRGVQVFTLNTDSCACNVGLMSWADCSCVYQVNHNSRNTTTAK